MKKPADYTPEQRVFIDRVFKPLAIAEAIDRRVTLTESQAVALAYVLAEAPEDLDIALTAFFAELPAPEYNLEFEHPVHTWGRWGAALDNDETPPCQDYSEYVAERLHGATVTIGEVTYSVDAGTQVALEAYFSRKTDRLKPHLNTEQFMRLVESRIQEGRLVALATAPTPRTATAAEVEQHFQESLRNGEHEPGDAVPFTDEELADVDADDDDMNPPNELAYEHL